VLHPMQLLDYSIQGIKLKAVSTKHPVSIAAK